MPRKPTSDGQQRLVCTPKRLPSNLLVGAARVAATVNPLNHAPVERLLRIDRAFAPTPARIAVLTTKYWGNQGVQLSVGFMDNPPKALRKRILQHMNAWNKTANIKFVETKTSPEVRIARQGGVDGGYWSYLGTDVLSIPANEPTMNLEAFTMQTRDSEFYRVVRHETGHTLGFPHEHMRKALVAKIDPKKAIKYFGETQGWTPEEVRAQVLTPLEERSLLGTVNPDPNSIMCYEIEGFLTKDGKPIIGGSDIDAEDAAFAGKIYPKKKSKSLKPDSKKLRSLAKGGAKRTSKR